MSPPTNAKALGFSAEGLQEHQPTSFYSAAGDNERKATAAKTLATLAAECALHHAATLQAIEGDDGRPEYVLVRNALCKRFGSLDEVRRWLNELQVRA